MIGAVLLVLVLGQPSADFRRGVEFGALEMAHTARLLGTHVRVAFDESETGDANALIVAAGAPRPGPGVPAIHVGSIPGGGGPCDFSIAPDRRSGSDVVAWHPALERYGASELNERFQRQFGTAMNEEAWMGWFAVKALVEAALRSPGAGGACQDLAALRFDGHKGRPLRFDPETHALSQPLYIVRNGMVIGEVK